MNLDDYLEDIDLNEDDLGQAENVLSRIEGREKAKEEVIDSTGYARRADFYSFLPQGRILGLDISKQSTGWTCIEDRKRTAGNISLTGEYQRKYPQHKELMLRVELKEKLCERFEGLEFDTIIIEDVFQGSNAKTVRILYDLNTAIDELIYEGKIKCRNFQRVSNLVWKKWLYEIDTAGETKGMKDKPRIQACLAMLGIHEEGEGFQDRLDSTGMIAGYYMHQLDEKGMQKKKLILSDVVIKYKKTKEEALSIQGNVVKISDGPIEVSDTKITKRTLEHYLLRNPDAVYVTKNKVPVGFLSKSLKPIEGGGYLAFWIRPSGRRKYTENV